ncbi:unnamed protein product [Onchocerca ochengi]|nr:unnamed protein product [Onchocerca ochengi]
MLISVRSTVFEFVPTHYLLAIICRDTHYIQSSLSRNVKEDGDRKMKSFEYGFNWYFVIDYNCNSLKATEDMGKATVDGKKPKAVKKMKDPNAPKRAMSAFFIWMNENRDRIKKPGMSVGDVAKAAGIEWAAMTDKSQWEKRAEEDKKRYEREIAAYKNKQ